MRREGTDDKKGDTQIRSRIETKNRQRMKKTNLSLEKRKAC